MHRRADYIEKSPSNMHETAETAEEMDVYQCHPIDQEIWRWSMDES
jgi:hypothetical protein